MTQYHNLERRMDNIEDKLNSLIKKVDESLQDSKDFSVRLNRNFTSFSRWLISAVLISFILCLASQSTIFYMLHEKINVIEKQVVVILNKTPGIKDLF